MQHASPTPGSPSLRVGEDGTPNEAPYDDRDSTPAWLRFPRRRRRQSSAVQRGGRIAPSSEDSTGKHTQHGRSHGVIMTCPWSWFTIAILYILFDVNYFLRIAFTIGWGRLFQKKKRLFDETSIYGLCTTQDVDLFLKHMNNARYLRELDFARFHYYDRTGIYAEISKRGGGAVQGASSVRYRRALPIFTPYKVTTKLLYWDDKNFYLEHQFISVSDNFVRAVILSKQSVTGLKVPVPEIVAKVDPTAQCPPVSAELKFWLDSMEESSQRLKKAK